MNFKKNCELLLESPQTSDWLKDAIRSMTARDVVDVARDAKLLASLAKQRLEEAVPRTRDRRAVR